LLNKKEQEEKFDQNNLKIFRSNKNNPVARIEKVIKKVVSDRNMLEYISRLIVLMSLILCIKG